MPCATDRGSRDALARVMQILKTAVTDSGCRIDQDGNQFFCR